MHENNGINPQSIIPNLKERDEIVLQWDINNKYDNTAIQVKTTSNQHLGWIARDDEVKPILINAFKNGYDVIAWVARTYDLRSKPGNLGLAIEFTIADKQSFQK